jgi:hypothetical protein
MHSEVPRSRQAKGKAWRESTRSSIIVERNAVKIESFLCGSFWPTACISCSQVTKAKRQQDRFASGSRLSAQLAESIASHDERSGPSGRQGCGVETA